jgi:hypothetical protein
MGPVFRIAAENDCKRICMKGVALSGGLSPGGAFAIMPLRASAPPGEATMDSSNGFMVFTV